MNSVATGGATGARKFPEGFVFGAGTASYQIEGGARQDGRGESIWDVFSRTPGKVFHGDTGDNACDSYNRVEDDVRIISELGLNSYRFSIAWPRVIPDGDGAVNQAGLDYYKRLASALREAGIMPVATVYHWDLPQVLEQRGGWRRRETAELLGRYAGIVGEALGDLVGLWITINEPLQIVHQGYRIGTHAPGAEDSAAAAAATHHVMLGHGYVLQALRGTVPAGIPIGPTMDIQPYIALDAASEATVDALDREYNRCYMDPVLHGVYPPQEREGFGPSEDLIKDGDMELIHAPIDFFGINYYRPHHIRAGNWDDLGECECREDGHPGYVEYFDPAVPRSVMGWPIVPEGLRDLLIRIDRESGGLPIYITENGFAADDYIDPEGAVKDYERSFYIHGHLGAGLDAIAAGVKLKGYFCWSLMDNFEWAHGYRYRFGLHYVDYETGRRVPKSSARFYGQVARSGELPALADAVPMDLLCLSHG